MPLNLLTNFEIQKYYQSKPKFKSFYSRNNFSKIKDGTYLLNVNEFKSIVTHWMALLIISNEEMNGIKKIAKSLNESGLLIKSVSETIKNKVVKEQEGGFLAMLLGALGTSLLGNLLTNKATIRTGEGSVTVGRIFNAA